MKLNPYLNFDGDCEAAFKFYERVLGGKIESKMTWGESPEANSAPPGWEAKIMHMHMTLGDQDLMGADCPPGYFEETRGMSVLINIEDPANAEATFAALSANGNIKMPIQETFWAARFGILIDQFGTPWMINCEKSA